MTLVCPRCKAKPRHVCRKLKGHIEVVHIERVEAAALKDTATKKARLKPKS
jgi:hypothetical protein